MLTATKTHQEDPASALAYIQLTVPWPGGPLFPIAAGLASDGRLRRSLGPVGSRSPLLGAQLLEDLAHHLIGLSRGR